MARYKALRRIAPWPPDGSAPDILPGIEFEVDERDKEARAYIEAVKETPGAVEELSPRRKEKEGGE